MKFNIYSIATLFFGIILSIMLSAMMLKYEVSEFEDNFSKRTSTITESIRHNFQDIAVADDKLSFLFQVSDEVSDDDFLINSQAIISDFSYVNAVFYASKIRNSHREIEELTIQKKGYTGFKFSTFSENKAYENPFLNFYFPVKFIQPYTPYSSVWFGKDLMTLPAAQDTLRNVVLAGKEMRFLVSDSVDLNKQGDFHIGSLAVNNVYLFSAVSFDREINEPVSAIEDTFGILGYQINLSQLLSQLNNQTDLIAHVRLDGKLIYSTGDIIDDQFFNVTYSENIDYEGQQIKITYHVSDPFLYVHYYIPLVILFLGLLITVFAFIAITVQFEKHRLLNGQNALIEKKVKEKTALLDAQAEEINKALNHQLSVSRELESFSYSISHDLRAPLRSISGFSNVLIEDYSEQLDEEAQNMLRRVERGAIKMSVLIDDLLSLSKISRQSLVHEKFAISDLAIKTVTEIRNRKVYDSFECEIEDNLFAEGDRNLVKIVLMNLISNAVKYSSTSSKPKIKFGMMKKDGKSVYYVQDNGVGFDMEYANKLFVAFQRLHGTEFEGTGIGLAIVQRVINRHGGDVWAESVQGERTTFYFTLN